MASEPVNIFSRNAMPAEVLAAVRSRYPNAEVVGDGDTWETITLKFGTGKAAKKLVLRHDPDYYAGPDWPTQRKGMQGYFGRFGGEHNLRVMALIGTFAFALATEFDPDYDDPADDERFAVVSGVTRLVDGAIFTPSALRDPAGRPLLDATGYTDPDAEWPGAPVGEDPSDGLPPSEVRVARRAVALAAVTARAVIERDTLAGEFTPEEAIDRLRKVREWVDAAGVRDEFEPAEAALFTVGPGSLPRQQAVNAMWRIEGLEVLAWALGLQELPRYDEMSTVDDVWRAVGFLDDDATAALLAAPKLRPREELDAVRKQFLGYNWRLTEFRVKPGTTNFRAFAAKCWFGSFDVSGFDLIDDDLAIGGDRIDAADPDLRGTCTSIALERHLAANWLCWGPDVYSDTDVST